MKAKINWTTDHRDWYRSVYLKSDHWADLKADKLEASPACERCGKRRELDVHHVNYRQLFDVSIQDLLTLCRKCHNNEHEQNGMPRRKRVSYDYYFPDHVRQRWKEQATDKRVVPHFDFTTEAGRVAYSIWTGKAKWRKSDLKRFGIQKPLAPSLPITVSPLIAAVALAFLLSGCSPPAPSQLDPVPVPVPLTGGRGQRFSVESHGSFEAGYERNIREILVIRDNHTGREYLAITGVGTAEIRQLTHCGLGRQRRNHSQGRMKTDNDRLYFAMIVFVVGFAFLCIHLTIISVKLSKIITLLSR